MLEPVAEGRAGHGGIIAQKLSGVRAHPVRDLHLPGRDDAPLEVVDYIEAGVMMTPQAILAPEFPDGSVIMSSAFA